MDPKKLFFDDRLKGFCVFCGAEPESRDHCPSKVLLEEPYPDNLPVVEACRTCNEGFSKDEQYLACLIECALWGSVQPSENHRPKIRRILSENPALAGLIGASYRLEAGTSIWLPDRNRVSNVVQKLARGHIAYELGLSHLELPESISFAPLAAMTAEERSAFEFPEDLESSFYPEVGSRAFMRTVMVADVVYPVGGWQVVQPGNYRYLVAQSDGDYVQMVLREYLACRVVWG